MDIELLIQVADQDTSEDGSVQMPDADQAVKNVLTFIGERDDENYEMVLILDIYDEIKRAYTQ